MNVPIRDIGVLFLFLLIIAPSAMAQNSSEVSNSLQKIDGTVRVTDYNLELNTPDYVVIEAKTLGTVSITDINSIAEKGTGRVNFKQVSYDAGRTNISLDVVQEFGDKSVIISKGNTAIYLSNDRTSDFIGSPDGFGFTLGAIGGGISIIILIVILVKHKKWKFNKKPLRVI